jgi:anti-sigma factor RsiW
VICKGYEHDLLAHLDGRLDHENTARVERHLGDCPACRKEAAAMRETWRLLGYLPGRNLSGRLPERLLEAARLQLEVEKRWSYRLLKHAPLIAAAAIVLAAVCVTILVGPPTAGSTDPDSIVAGLSDEEKQIVQHLDLYENLETVQNLDALEDDQVVEYLEAVQSITDEDF